MVATVTASTHESQTPRPTRQWAAQDTSTDRVASALRRLLHEAEHSHGRHVSSRTLNLVVGPGETKMLGAARQGVVALHPARMVLLVEHQPNRLDAEVQIHTVAVPNTHLRLLVEDIEVAGNRDRLVHLQSLLAPLLARGIPTAAWLPGFDHGPIEQSLARTADVTIFDSDLDPDPGRALLFAYATALNHPTRDLAWLRTARWRSRISATFATTEALGTLAFRPSAEIIGNVQQPAAILLAAWVASRVHINVSLRQGSGADPVEAVTVAGIVINAGSG